MSIINLFFLIKMWNQLVQAQNFMTSSQSDTISVWFSRAFGTCAIIMMQWCANPSKSEFLYLLAAPYDSFSFLYTHIAMFILIVQENSLWSLSTCLSMIWPSCWMRAWIHWKWVHTFIILPSCRAISNESHVLFFSYHLFSNLSCYQVILFVILMKIL